MSTVGNILRESRNFKKLTLSDVSNELKISKSTLLNIENDYNEFEVNAVYYIGHIRSYADFLNLDTETIILKYKNQISFKKNDIKTNISRPSFDIYISKFQKVLPASLVIIISFTFYFLFINESDKRINYALIPEIPENYIPIIEQTEIETALKQKNNNENKELKNNNYSNPSGAIASNKTNDKSLKNQVVTLKFLNSTWIQLRDKSDKVIISRLMEKNEEYSYDINLGYNITAGNAGNIIVIIDNNVKGKIGKHGEILDSYILDNNFTN